MHVLEYLYVSIPDSHPLLFILERLFVVSCLAPVANRTTHIPPQCNSEDYFSCVETKNWFNEISGELVLIKKLSNKVC